MTDVAAPPVTVQSSLNLILPIKSEEARQALEDLMPEGFPLISEAATAIGTLHDSRFVVLGPTTVGLFTAYDGTFEDYISDFTKHLGDLFDAIFGLVEDPPPLPVEKNTEAFMAWIRAHDLPPVYAYYSAYPTLTVQDIKALAAGH